MKLTVIFSTVHHNGVDYWTIHYFICIIFIESFYYVFFNLCKHILYLCRCLLYVCIALNKTLKDEMGLEDRAYDLCIKLCWYLCFLNACLKWGDGEHWSRQAEDALCFWIMTSLRQFWAQRQITRVMKRSTSNIVLMCKTDSVWGPERKKSEGKYVSNTVDPAAEHVGLSAYASVENLPPRHFLYIQIKCNSKYVGNIITSWTTFRIIFFCFFEWINQLLHLLKVVASGWGWMAGVESTTGVGIQRVKAMEWLWFDWLCKLIYI